MLMGRFSATALRTSGKEGLEDLDIDDVEPILAAALQVPDPDKEKASQEALGAYMQAMAKGETAELDEEVANANFATTLREFTIWSYKNSEYVGEQVLPYAQVPGENIACADLNELTGGKVWSPER